MSKSKIHIVQARLESWDLEQEVCKSQDLSYHLVPYPLKVHRRR